MEEKLRRPGGALASRPLHFIWMVDCSGSMFGDKIQSLNYAIRQTIPDMKVAAEDNPNAELLIRTLKFSTGAQWVTSEPVAIDKFQWDDLEAYGVTTLGAAFSMVAEELDMPPMSERALPPVMVLLSDGQPTDSYKEGLNKLMSTPWGKKAVKIAISIGQDADDNVLTEFTGNRELVLQANNPQALVKMIKWASTVAKQVSSPNSNPMATSIATAAVDTNNIPTVSTENEDIW